MVCELLLDPQFGESEINAPHIKFNGITSSMPPNYSRDGQRVEEQLKIINWSGWSFINSSRESFPRSPVVNTRANFERLADFQFGDFLLLPGDRLTFYYHYR